MLKTLCDIPVEEYTSPDPVSVSFDTPLPKILKLMRENGFRHIPVLKDHVVVGIISDRDVLVSHSFTNESALTAEQVMSKSPYTVTMNTSLDKVVFELSNHKRDSAIVTDNAGKLYGIFTATDALNALVEILRGQYP